MKELKVVHFCPFGNECESVKDNKIYRCVFFVALKGTNPQDGEKIDEWACSIAWLPMLLCENTQAGKNTRDSIDIFKNEVKLFEDNFIKAAIIASQNRKELRDNDDDNNKEREIIINDDGFEEGETN